MSVKLLTGMGITALLLLVAFLFILVRSAGRMSRLEEEIFEDDFYKHFREYNKKHQKEAKKK